MKNKAESTDSKQASETIAMKKVTTYMIDGRKFVVTPVFREEGRETFGSILMRLMKSEISVQP
ncbi:MAG: hypothetical protein J6K03_05170 [Oscillospiraceae bacterium]|nr:hypothetical protein [Oscillospiraceae bacterium]